MSTQVSQNDGETGGNNWAYIFESDGVMLAFRTRHDAVGFKAIWPHDAEIRTEPHHSENELTTLLNTDT